MRINRSSPNREQATELGISALGRENGTPAAAPKRSSRKQREASIGELDRALTSLNRALSLIAAKKHLGDGENRLDRSAYVALGKLDEAGPMRLTDLAASLGLDSSTASRQLSDLFASGLVEKSADPADKRAHVLSLSPAGLEVLSAARIGKRKIISEAVEGWDSESCSRAAELMLALAARFHDYAASHGEVKPPAPLPPGQFKPPIALSTDRS